MTRAVPTRIGFAYNPTKEDAVELLGAGHRLVRDARDRELGRWPRATRRRSSRPSPATDVLVVLGGDGTFLRAARAVAEVDVPIVGVNLGKVGFLSKAEAHELEGAAREDRRGALPPRGPDGAARRRSAAQVGTAPRDTFIALNDVVIARGALARVVHLDVEIGPSHLATFIADGLVVASPTGSTGYSFSAGGPILDPLSRNLIVTPIAAYLVGDRLGRREPRPGRPLPGHRGATRRSSRSTGARTSRSGSATSSPSRPWSSPIRFLEPEGAVPFWDLLRQKAQLLPS